MSRSLLLAFIMALILHSLLAWVDLDVYKRPIPIRSLPKTLTIDIPGPRPVKKPSFVKKPSIVVKRPEKKPIVKKMIKREVKQKLSPKPKIKEEKRIQQEKSIIKEKPPKKDETLAHLPQVDSPAIEREEIFVGEDKGFVPDMVDIPMALPKRKDIPDTVKGKGLPVPPSHIPVTSALPIYKKNTPPQYPLLARRRGYQGKVLLDVLVKKDGTAGSIRLARSSGYEILDRAAIKEVRKWLFHPAKRGDESVEMWVEIPIRFQLK